MLENNVRTGKRCSTLILKNPQVRSELRLSALGLFFQEQKEGDQLCDFMVRGPSSHIYHIWISTIKIYLSIYGCRRRNSTKERVRYSFPPYYFFLFKRNSKAIPTLYCCNIIDLITYFILMIWIIKIYLLINNHFIFIKINCFHCLHWPFWRKG